jgi:hypothetical protein
MTSDEYIHLVSALPVRNKEIKVHKSENTVEYATGKIDFKCKK